jgi:hypothetical protein
MWNTRIPIIWELGAVPSGIKRQGLEADHLPSSSVEIKNAGIIFYFAIRLHAVVIN